MATLEPSAKFSARVDAAPTTPPPLYVFSALTTIVLSPSCSSPCGST